MGINKKVIVKLRHVTSIKYCKVLGLFNTGVIVYTDDGKYYTFSSFTNKKSAYNQIVVVWKQAAPDNFEEF